MPSAEGCIRPHLDLIFYKTSVWVGLNPYKQQYIAAFLFSPTAYTGTDDIQIDLKISTSGRICLTRARCVTSWRITSEILPCMAWGTSDVQSPRKEKYFGHFFSLAEWVSRENTLILLSVVAP